MPAQRRSSDQEDPLAGYSGLSLFPRTLASVPNAPKPYDNDDIRHAHNFLKSMPFEIPNKLLEQAKAIVDGSSVLSMSEILSYATSKHKNEVVTKVIENPQERRPALGRKRAQFSLKPKSSQPPVSLEPSLEIDRLKDPEEFFLAFEKLENAKRELQKQTGGILMDLNQKNLSMAARPRRPGILGRSVKYKHHYLNDMPSQETFEENILSPSDYNVKKETINPDVASQERELADAELQEMKLVGPVAKSGKRVNELLDELLAGNDEELDEDGAVTLLQEHLQIKPIDLEKLCLPDLEDVRRIDFKASGADLPNPRNALLNITNFLKGMSSKTSKKRKLAEIPIPCHASPTPPKNPLGSIISLKKRILRSNSSVDPFSADNIDQSHARNASPFGCIKKQKDEVNVEKELSISPKLKSPMIEDNGIADVNTSLPELTIGDVTRSSDNTVNDNQSRLSSGVAVGSSEFHADLESSFGGSCVDNSVVSETLGRPDGDTDVPTNEPTEFNDKIEDVLREAAESVQPYLDMENSTAEKLNSTQNQTSRDVVEDHAMDGPSKTADTGPEQRDEQEVQISARDPFNEQSKAISSPRKKGKREGASGRQSLAASGTSWELGVRRSTRIRSRPLEYWKGERFLYGRVHQSLTTVIGIKYESPGNADGKPGIKVKSFVSDEYKDLVDLAARF